jgi:hypothetical protein
MTEEQRLAEEVGRLEKKLKILNTQFAEVLGGLFLTCAAVVIANVIGFSISWYVAVIWFLLIFCSALMEEL